MSERRRRRQRRLKVIGAIGLLLLTAPFLRIGSTNSISAPYPSLIERGSAARDINKFKPAECTMTVSNLITTGPTAGTAANDLIIGKQGNGGSLEGAGGDDCIVGNNSGSTLTGGGGIDVCIKGPTDSYNLLLDGCETKVG